jgi:hypothetical protein
MEAAQSGKGTCAKPTKDQVLSLPAQSGTRVPLALAFRVTQVFARSSWDSCPTARDAKWAFESIWQLHEKWKLDHPAAHRALWGASRVRICMQTLSQHHCHSITVIKIKARALHERFGNIPRRLALKRTGERKKVAKSVPKLTDVSNAQPGKLSPLRTTGAAQPPAAGVRSLSLPGRDWGLRAPQRWQSRRTMSCPLVSGEERNCQTNVYPGRISTETWK